DTQRTIVHEDRCRLRVTAAEVDAGRRHPHVVDAVVAALVAAHVDPVRLHWQAEGNAESEDKRGDCAVSGHANSRGLMPAASAGMPGSFSYAVPSGMRHASCPAISH